MLGVILAMADPIRVQIQAKTYSKITVLPTTATQTVVFDNDGNVYDNGAPDYAWELVGSASDYELMWVKTGGDTFNSAPTESSWLSLGTDRGFTLTALSGIKSVTMTVTIRPAGGGAWTKSASITVYAEATS